MTSLSKMYTKKIKKQISETPYNVPYVPNIWGAGLEIQNFGMKQYFYHVVFPEYFPKSYMLNALDFILGTHPVVNISCFASRIGVGLLTQAYRINRGEHSHIPRGIGSGTALIRLIFPNLLNAPVYGNKPNMF
ncbi:hypothetical protein [Yeosuana aromativorans]|nr:hypothetical protein [Yeosuana aromativorans]